CFELLREGGDDPLPVPFDESAPLRERRYPYRGMDIGEDDYDKLDVEPSYLARGASVLRLAMIYGPRDPQTREEFVLRRGCAAPASRSARPARSSRDCTSTMRRPPCSPRSTGRMPSPAKCSTWGSRSHTPCVAGSG